MYYHNLTPQRCVIPRRNYLCRFRKFGSSNTRIGRWYSETKIFEEIFYSIDNLLEFRSSSSLLYFRIVSIPLSPFSRPYIHFALFKVSVMPLVDRSRNRERSHLLGIDIISSDRGNNRATHSRGHRDFRRSNNFLCAITAERAWRG